MKSIWTKWLREAVFIYCVVYTVATICNSVIYLIEGIYEDPSGNWHELDRAVIVLIGVLAYSMIKNIKSQKYFMKAIIVYIPTLLLAFFYVWLVGFRGTLAKTAYRDIFLNYTIGFVVVSVITYIISVFTKVKRKSKN